MKKYVSKQARSWALVIEGAANDPVVDFDVTDKKPCGPNHRCAFMRAALDSKGSLGEVFSFKGASSVAFFRKARGRKQPPFLILSVCPWCREQLG